MKLVKRSAWLALLIFILVELVLFCLPGYGTARLANRQSTSELLLSACFFSFISLLYFIPRINKFWKIPIYGMLITSLGVLILFFGFGLTKGVQHVLNGKPIGMFFESSYDMSRLQHVLTELCIFSMSFNIAPLMTLSPYYFLQKRLSKRTDNGLSSPKGIVSKIFHCKIKLILFSMAVYIVFIITYDLFIRPKWPMVIYNIPYEGPLLRSYILYYVLVLYFISFFSLLISMPSLIGQVKKGIAFCVMTPLFWNFIILSVYALMIFLTTWNTRFFREDIFTLNYYFGRYFDTRAWFVSFPLLAVWGFRCLETDRP